MTYYSSVMVLASVVIAAYAANRNLSPVIVSDTSASVAAHLDALNAVARADKITSIALTDAQPVRIANAQMTSGTVAALGSGVTLNVGLAPTSGVEEIANFQYGVDQLSIDLQGSAATRLAAFDTSVNGWRTIWPSPTGPRW